MVKTGSHAALWGRIAESMQHAEDGGPLRTLPARLLGLSLYWAWIWTLLIADMSEGGGLIGGFPASVGEYAVRALALAGAMVFARRTPASRFVGAAAKAAGVLGPLGVLALVAFDQLGGAGALGVAAWVPIGVADALLLVGWLDLYRYLGLRRAIIAVCLSSVAAVPLLLVASALQGPTAIIVVAAMPALCALALHAARATCSPATRRDMEAAPAAHVRRPAKFGKVIMLIGVYGFAFGCMQAFTYAEDGASIPLALRALAICLGTLLALAVSLAPNASKTNAIFRIALPLTACGLLLAPLIGDDFAIAGSLVIAGFFLFDILSITILLRLCALYDLPATSTLGLGRLANAVGIFGSWLAVRALAGAIAPDDATLAAASSILLLVLMVTSGTLLDVDGRDDGEDVDAAAEDGSSFAKADVPAAPPVSGGRWHRQCELVSTQYGLSPRESEVLELLAKGRDAVYIATLFVISPHTAKTHIHNVYKKLGIHSQQELIDIVEEAARDLKDTAPRRA